MLVIVAVVFVLNLVWFMKNAHAEEISTARDKVSHKLHELGDHVLHGIEMASQRIRPSPTSRSSRNSKEVVDSIDNVNPMHSTTQRGRTVNQSASETVEQRLSLSLLHHRMEKK